ncbi:MAG: alpha/beta fold hydrolase [Anaerolineae bacterium]
MLDPKSDTFSVKNFQFQSGETLPELRIHYRTLGEPKTDGYGRVNNAVLIMHGTSGSGEAFLAPHFAGELFGVGQLLDLDKYFIILPDGIGHGGSSRPSDGLRANFPNYGYLDMVTAQHQLVTEHLEIERLRLVMGTSMGGMHSWMWGYLHPEMVDALMPLVSLPVEIAGRNRMMRHMIFDAITQSPDYDGGNYTEQPFGLTAATHLVMLMVGSPYQLQKIAPTQQKADALFAQMVPGYRGRFDANDLLYQFRASHDYNPQPHLEKIIAPLTAINAADDLVNPPELGVLEQEIGRVPQGKAVVLDNWPELQGHRSHSYPVLWKEHLADLLKRSEPQN